MLWNWNHLESSNLLECSTAIGITSTNRNEAYMQLPMIGLEFWWACEPLSYWHGFKPETLPRLKTLQFWQFQLENEVYTGGEGRHVARLTWKGWAGSWNTLSGSQWHTHKHSFLCPVAWCLILPALHCNSNELCLAVTGSGSCIVRSSYVISREFLH